MAEASEKSFPFDAEQVSGEYDRVYVADDFAMYFRAFITSGIFLIEINLALITIFMTSAPYSFFSRLNISSSIAVSSNTLVFFLVKNGIISAVKTENR